MVSFGAGEPDFATPSLIVDAAVAALREGLTRYTPTPGLPDLREAAASKLRRENRIDCTAEQIVVSSGAKHSLFNTLMCLVDPGDEVVVFSPYWMTYIEQVSLCGGVPVVVPTEAANGFVPTLDAIERAVSPRTKALILNSPCNPTGAVFPSETVEWIAQQALRLGFWIVSDEIYERLVYGRQATSPASLGPEVASQTVTINGCSKSYAMTGWRIGYACAPVPLARSMSNLQDQVTSNATSFAQRGAVRALEMGTPDLEPMRREFQTRRDLMVEQLNQIPGLTVTRPEGAFYVLPDVKAYLGRTFATDADLARHLLEGALVATVPGSVFGAPGHIRLSYATSQDDIVKGVGRIAEALQVLAP